MAIVTHLIANQFGSHIGKYHERLKVTYKGEEIQKAPLMHLEAVYLLTQGVSISSDAIEACCERGIPIFMLNGCGQPYASIYAAGLSGTVVTRREQLRAYDDARGVYLARQFALGKLNNQANTLRYLAKNRKDSPAGEELHLTSLDLRDSMGLLERENDDSELENVRSRIMGIEGAAAHRYWEAVKPILPPEYGWQGRMKRGARDPINNLLNYGYGILYGQVERALVLAGLDPYAGFLHADRPGKPSLVLDMVEEFRQVVVDRVVFGLAARRFHVGLTEEGMMDDTTRCNFAEHILNHLEATVRYEGNRHPIKHVIQMQARMLASYIRGDRSDYAYFKME